MSEQNKPLDASEIELTWPGRRHALGLLGIGFFVSITACGRDERSRRSYIELDVEMFSYIDRVITDIIFNDTDLGVMNRYGGTGLITGVRIPFGEQALTWTLGGPEGTPRNGEQVKIKNTLVIAPEQIPRGAHYLGLHLYPDDTAEAIFSEEMPEESERGRQIMAAR
jgi:hypothetical protein